MTSYDSRAASASPAATNDFAMFADWCMAAGQSLTDITMATLIEYAEFVPGGVRTQKRRVRNAIAGLTRNGIVISPANLTPHTPGHTVWRTPRPGWDTPDDALARIVTDGWPAGLRGRRDAFLVLCCGTLHMSRNQVRALTRDDVDLARWTIRGLPLADNQDPARCPRCVATRWLRLLAVYLSDSDEVRLALLKSARSPALDVHDHLTPVPDSLWERWVVAGRPRKAWLAAAISRTGHVNAYRQISLRSLTTIIAARQQAPAAGPERPPATPWQAPTSGERPERTLDEIDQDLATTSAEIDRIMARIQAEIASWR